MLLQAGVELKHDATVGGTLSYTQSATVWHVVGVEVRLELEEDDEADEILDEEPWDEELEELCANAFVVQIKPRITNSFFIIIPFNDVVRP